MLSESEIKLITQTGPGTSMGDVMRRFWHPFLSSDEMEKRYGTPVRVKLLSEELVAFAIPTVMSGFSKSDAPTVEHPCSLASTRNAACSVPITVESLM